MFLNELEAAHLDDYFHLALFACPVEYANCITADGKIAPNERSDMTLNCILSWGSSLGTMEIMDLINFG